MTCAPGWLNIYLFWLTGYKKIAESQKPTATSFSFGKRHTHNARNDTDGPGPANYDVSGLSTKGKFAVK